MSLKIINTKNSPESFAAFADELKNHLREKEQLAPKLSVK